MRYKPQIRILVLALLIPVAIRMFRMIMPSPPQTAIVIGTGLAGLSAASTLLSHRIPVLLLDRSPKPGGNSIKASSGINGSPTPYQSTSSDGTFYIDTIKSAGSILASSYGKERERREALIKTLVNESGKAVEWLVEKGVDLSHVTQLGGHSAPRTHRGRGKTPPGYAIISTLLDSLKGNPDFTFSPSSRVTEILKDEKNHVVGVKYMKTLDAVDGKEMGEKAIEKEMEVRGPVMFATGGFAGDSHGLLARYRPDLEGMPSTNDARPGSTDLLTTAGAALIDMHLVQVHPTAFVDLKNLTSVYKFLAAEMLRGEGGVLLRGREGTRFVNELDTRERVTAAIMEGEVRMEDGLKMWDVDLVMDEGAYEAGKSHVDFYLWKGLMHKGTVAELGGGALASLQAYAHAARGEGSDEFGRTLFGHWKLKDVVPESVIYSGKITPAIHFTMGGVVINENAEVLDEKAEAIQGLWAAGEVTGGLHGENRLGGSSLLECVVFGRRAGENIARLWESKQ